MDKEGVSFETVLKEAQDLGYAERNPAADVEGHDACRKICIISSLVYGKHVYPESVYTKGITDVKLEDVQIVSKFGAIKLIARVKELENGKILPTVMPMIVPFDNLMSRVDDVFNAVMVYGDGIDKTMFYGRGAGKLPTASAVLADVIESVKHDRTVFSQMWNSVSDNSFVEDYRMLEAKVYFRVETDSIEKISEIAGNAEFICEETNQTAFVTDVITLKSAEEISARFEANGINVVSVLPVL